LCVNTFAYDFSAHLADILAPLTGKSGYTVTNSTHFVSTISHERIQENEVMVSFDVESLFTNLPIEAAVKAALCKLENDPGLADRTNLTPTHANCRPFELCLKIHAFPIQRVDLRAKRRTSFGEPCLRGYCYNLYMEEFEERAIATAT